MTLRARLFGFTGFSVLAFASAASAQAAGGGAAPPPAGTLQEVVVTAQRRSESMQDVPITINVASAQRLEAANVQSLPQLSQITPGLQFQAVGAVSVPFLRGVGAGTTSAGSEAAVALVVDGVYVSAQPASLMSLSNVEAVEVDRGPQGTLFGRNATGGVIQIRTRTPTQERKLDLTAGYGNYNTVDGSLYAAGGITQNLAADLAISGRDQRDGFGKNLATGADVYKSWDYTFRSKWVWTPTDRTKLTAIGDWSSIYSQTGFATRLPRPGELGLNERGHGGYVFNGGFYDVALDFPSFSRATTSGGSVDLLQDLGVAQFRSITAYHRQHSVGQVDFDFTPTHGSHQRNNIFIKTWSEELQLLSPDSMKKFTWVAGAYFYWDDSTYEPLFIDYPAGALLSDTTVNGRLKTQSWSLFGQGTYEIVKDTRLTLGLRFTQDEREVHDVQTSIGPVPGNVDQTGRSTFPKLTYRAALDHRFDNILVYLQASRGFKSGFYNNQTLQPATGRIALPINPETLDAYEVGLKSDWFERRLRVNLSAFHYNYTNQQVNAFLGSTRIILNAASSRLNGVDFEFIAVPVKNLTVSLNGEWLDASYRHFPGAPLYTPAVAPLIGNIVTPFDASGKRVINSPRFTTTLAGDYTIPLATGKLVLSGNLYHNTGFYWDFANIRKEPAYTLLSASVKYSFGDREQWDVMLWGNNLLDEKIHASANQVGAGPQGLFGGDSITVRPPRTFGVRFGAHF